MAVFPSANFWMLSPHQFCLQENFSSAWYWRMAACISGQSSRRVSGVEPKRSMRER